MNKFLCFVVLLCAEWTFVYGDYCSDGFELESSFFSNSSWSAAPCVFNKRFRCVRREIVLRKLGIEIRVVQGACVKRSECSEPCRNFVREAISVQTGIGDILQSLEVRSCRSICCNSDSCNSETIESIRQSRLTTPPPPTPLLPCVSTSEMCSCTIDEVSALQEEIRMLKRAFTPEPGWFTPQNGYQYQLTETRQNWFESRRICQARGGDLAAEGMRNFTTRFIIARTISSGFSWIGLSDIEMEGKFVWVDGVICSPSNAHWKKNEPSRYGAVEDCAEIFRITYRTNDRNCNDKRPGLCEKRL